MEQQSSDEPTRKLIYERIKRHLAEFDMPPIGFPNAPDVARVEGAPPLKKAVDQQQTFGNPLPPAKQPEDDTSLALKFALERERELNK